MTNAALAQEIDLQIDGMSCASCVRRVEKALSGVPGVARADVNLATRRAHVVLGQGNDVETDALLAAVARRGYAAQPILQQAAAQAPGEDAAAGRRFAWALVLTLPVFLLEMGGHLIPALHTLVQALISPRQLGAVEFVLCTAVLAGPGRSFFTRGGRALAHGGPDMNTLVALGAGSAWLYSTLVTFTPTLFPPAARHLYFEAAAVVATLILLGRWLEARARGRANTAIRELMALQPDTAWVRRDQQWQEIPAATLQVGDEIRIRPGEKVPVDGIVIDGESWVDESMITGESMPVRRHRDDPVVGGTLNERGQLIVQATQVGADTTLAHIIRRVEQAQASKLPIQQAVDRVTGWFVPVVMGTALLTLAVWLLWGPEPRLTHALIAAVAVLIIACPCAMGLATPISVMVASGRAARSGILLRGGDTLQRLRDVRLIAFDKTGTLTMGKPALTDLVTHGDADKDRLLTEIAALQQGSEHPIARAVLAAAQGRLLPAPETFEAVTGLGIRGRLAGQDWLVGNLALMHDQGVEVPAVERAQVEAWAQAGKTPFLIACQGRLAGLAAVADTLRPDARAAIARLHALGIETALISGDHPAATRAVADALGIDHVHAQARPEDKATLIQALRVRHAGPVAFVGDGINDAPALAQADVGFAMGRGTDVAIESAQVVLMTQDLNAIARAIRLSRLTLRNIHQNLFWAFAYNAVLIPVAAGALYPVLGIQLSPILGAGAMALSSVFVVSNALRLKRLPVE